MLVRHYCGRDMCCMYFKLLLKIDIIAQLKEKSLITYNLIEGWTKFRHNKSIWFQVAEIFYTFVHIA